MLLIFSMSAMAIDVNELCLKANINSLRQLGIDDLDGENICDKPVSSLTEFEKINLNNIINVHTKVADLFGVSVPELFPEAIDVDILETTMGGLYSYAGGESITLGVYPETNYNMDLGVYTHELGHVLSGGGNPKLPSSFADLDDSILFTEMFADMLSLSLFDKIIIPVEGQESCIDRTRYITRGQTYNMPQEYFLSDFSMARVAQCCQSYTIEKSSKVIKNLCEEFAKMGEFTVKLTTPFDPHTVVRKSVDEHQIGIPLLSFMNELSVVTKLGMNNIFKLGFKHDIPKSESFTCSGTLEDKILETKVVEINTVRSFMEDLKASLLFADQLSFDLLFSKYAIEKGLEFGDLETQGYVIRKANIECLKTSECQVACLKN